MTRDRGDLDAARAYARREIRAWQALGATWNLASAHHGLGQTARQAGDDRLALACFHKALRLVQTKAKDSRLEIALLSALGRLEADQGDHAAGKAWHTRAVALARRSQSLREIAFALDWAGETALAHGDLPAARSCFNENLTISEQLGNRQHAAVALDHLARVELASECGAGPLRAARLFGAAAAVGGPLLDDCLYGRQPARHQAIAAAREALGEKEFALAWAWGARLTLDQAVRFAVERP
jgi:tetratricopeptide (TPR) repeat protein